MNVLNLCVFCFPIPHALKTVNFQFSFTDPYICTLFNQYSDFSCVDVKCGNRINTICFCLVQRNVMNYQISSLIVGKSVP